MGIKVTGGKRVREAVSAALEAKMYRVREIFLYVGEAAVNEARNNHRYKDQTGNLTSSIGYVLCYDGKIVTRSAFNQVNGASADKDIVKDGGRQGESFAEELAAKTGAGYTLIVVAGMKYAKVVNDKGYNVTDSATIIAKNLLKALLPRIL